MAASAPTTMMPMPGLAPLEGAIPAGIGSVLVLPPKSPPAAPPAAPVGDITMGGVGAVIICTGELEVGAVIRGSVA